MTNRQNQVGRLSVGIGALAACLLGASCRQDAPSETTDPGIAAGDPLATGTPQAETAAGTLEFPLVVEGACPFECCTYGAWVATAAIDVRTEPRMDAEVAVQLQPGERFEAPTGSVIVSAPGLARVDGRVQLYRPDGARGPEVGPGTELTVLEPQAEGFFWVWFEGRRWSTDLGFMDEGRMGGEIVEPAVWRWWVSVRTGSGQTGWIAPEGSDVNGQRRVRVRAHRVARRRDRPRA